MKICDFCKNEIDENAKFCPVCGAEQKSEPIAEQPQPTADTAAAEPFGTAQPEAMPFGAAPVNQNQPPVNSGTYFTPGANVNVNPNTEMFNGGAPVQNVAQRKKGKGGKIALIIIGIIVLLVVALIVFGALSGDDSDVNDPSAGTSQSAGGKTAFEHGTVDESGYTNESLGIRINCPEEWEVLMGDDMSEFFDIYPNADGQYKDVDGSVYEFAAMNPDSGANIIVSSIEGNIADALTSEDEFINDLADDYNGVNEKASAPFEKTIGSRTYKCIDIDSLSGGEQVQQRMIVAKERKQYFCVVITVFPDYETATLDELTDNYLTNN